MLPLRVERGPQRLKPDLILIRYVRAKARTLQQQAFLRSLQSPRTLQVSCSRRLDAENQTLIDDLARIPPSQTTCEPVM
jgi:hypothetical protein